jgi:hypothetical protein
MLQIPQLMVATGAAALLCLVASMPVSAQEQSAGAIHILVFADTDLDGQLDDSETPTGLEVVQLFLVGEDGKRTLVQTGKTDENGQFVFDDLPFGQYVVVYALSTGVTIETLPLTVSGAQPVVFVKPAPVLPKDRRFGFSLLNLGFRNPANVIGDQVSRFAPNP